MTDKNSTAHHSLGLEDTYSSKHPWQTIYLLYGQDKRLFWQTVIFFLIKHSPIWVMPLVTANIINILADPTHHNLRQIFLYGLIGALVTAQNVPSNLIYYKSLSLMARNGEAALRSAICRRLQQINISFYKEKSSGALQSKALRDVEAIDLMVRGLFDGGLGAIGTLVPALIVTALRAPYMLLLYMLIIPPVSLLRKRLGDRMKRSNSAYRLEVESMSSRIGNMIDMIPISRAHAVEDIELGRIEEHLGHVRQAGLKVDRNNALLGSISWVLFQLLYVTALITAAWLCFAKIIPLKPGDVVMLTQYLLGISGAIMTGINMFPSIAKGFESVRSIGDVLESPDVEKNIGKSAVDKVDGGFVFEKLSFTYPGSDDAAIQDISLEVRAGSTVAFVGESGSGKSTIMGLILGYQRPTTGRILLDGHDMNDLDLRTFREKIAVVSQETLLFQGTLRENIIYGAKDVTEERLNQAVIDANAESFVSKLPDGLDTMLGEKGARLSGGQRQRIAIARAIIRNPRVLILDEATSALDSESEFQVQSALDRLMQGRTSFIVAHRLSTIRNADQVVVLSSGRILEHGSLQELLSRDGSFSAMYNLQTGGFKGVARFVEPVGR